MKTVYHPEHPHYAVHKQYIEGCFANPDNPPAVQWRARLTGLHLPLSDNPPVEQWREASTWFDDDCTSWSTSRHYRIKPRIITRTVTYPEPIRQKPDYGSTFWVVHPSRGIPAKLIWDGCSSDLLALKNGMCFANEKDAQACYAALF